MSQYKILIVDDDPVFLRTTKRFLETHGFFADTLGTPTEVSEVLKTRTYHCLLLDIEMPAMSGIEVLQDLQKKHMSIPVIVISGRSTIEQAVQAIKLGAFDFIEKPIDTERLLNTIQNAIDKFQLIEANEVFYRELQKNFQLIGKSKAMMRLSEMIRKAASVDSKVLITGESGTGKSLIARAIHYQSSRKTKPFITTNCAAIPSHLLESELFGYKKGSFTDAKKDHKGKFWIANGGTIFLDEIGDMDLHMQAKLLNVLQENQIQIIGEPLPREINVRVIAATNKNLEKLVQEGKFREDLFYRLNVIHIHVPPLRERKDDILPLAYHFLKKFSQEFNKPIQRIHPLVESVLQSYDWPGNIRELENLVQRLVIFCESDEITIEDYLQFSKHKEDWSDNIFNITPNLNYHKAMEFFESKFLAYMLELNQWNVQKTAQAIEIDRSNLYKKLRKYNLIKFKKGNSKQNKLGSVEK